MFYISTLGFGTFEMKYWELHHYLVIFYRYIYVPRCWSIFTSSYSSLISPSLAKSPLHRGYIPEAVDTHLLIIVVVLVELHLLLLVSSPVLFLAYFLNEFCYLLSK